MKTVILPKPYHQIFEDAAKAFAAEVEEDTLCFGAQDWTIEEIMEQRKLAHGKFIAYQSELLYEGNMPFRNEEYVAKLKWFDEIWDYSIHNLDFLHKHGITNVIYKPLLPNEVLRDTPLEKDIDVFHFGSWSRHRAELLNVAISAGFRVYDVVLMHHKMIYGEELHLLIRRSKVVLGLHSFSQSPLQESFRYQYPLSNDIKVLAEKSLSNPLNLVEFADAKEMLEKLKQIVDPVSMTQDEVLENHIFTHHPSYLGEAEKYCPNRNLTERLSYAVKYINTDIGIANEMRHLQKRTKDIEAIEFKIFDDLIRISILLIRNCKVLGRKTVSDLSDGCGHAYRKLKKTAIRDALLSTGGKIMPRLRCVFLLHGWGLMKLSLKVALMFHEEKKLIRYISNDTYL